ncbi:MAG: FtsX-like permease family protein [Tannerella sp.]|jgi:lipoprotein-releasing system permease protein|nr:FtsX-like permease family protein [Tannerella sp.]
MNFELFLAKKIHFSKDKGDNRRVTPPVIRIAMAGIAIGLAVMIVSVAVVVGFKKEVRNKVIGFGSHIQLTNFDNNTSYETIPIAVNDSLREALTSTEGVRHIEVFATKPGIIKTNNDFQGIVLRGIGSDFDTTFFKKHLVEGEMLHIDSQTVSTDVLVSYRTANMLHLGYNDSFLAYFVNNGDVRPRKLRIAGIYNTGFSDYDKLFVICDIRQVRRINGWDDDMASGVGIFIDHYNHLDDITEELYFSLIDRKDRLGNTYYIRSIKELSPMIFNWLAVLDSNVVVILVLMILVSGFTMISGLLIIILERTNMIGILKTLGESNYSIRKVFLYVSFFLIVKGMFWGNVIGLGICFLQSHFKWIRLDPEIYYLDSVPIEISVLSFLIINIGSLSVSMLMMIAPSFLITKIEPARSIRFE